MAKNTDYNSSDIKVLTDQEHVRLRLGMYAGSSKDTQYTIPNFDNPFKFSATDISFTPASYKLFSEIVDNSQDEHAQLNKKNKYITINSEDDVITISDNGRGIPIDKHSSGIHTPQLVFGSLRSGRNFSDDKQSGVIGQNGMGSSITCICSEFFNVTINRDGKKYIQTFNDGCTKVSKPKITKGPAKKTGTTVSYKLDPSLFETVSIPNQLMVNRAREVAFNNPGLEVEYNGTKFKYNNGLEDIVKEFSKSYFKFSDGNMDFFIITDAHIGIDERMFTWVNGSLLFDGGICNTQFLNAFIDAAVNNTKTLAKRNKCVITKNDIKENLLILGTMRVSDPEYDAQSKTRLTGPNLRKEMVSIVNDNWKTFSRKNKDWIESVLNRAIKRHRKDTTDTLAKEIQKQSRKKIPGLLDATDKVRYNCNLLITEGLSASAGIAEVRDPKTIATLPLTGKINNVHGANASQLSKMSKTIDLLSAIGLIPGKPASRSSLRFGKIISATDADPDGGDIFVLLINLLYNFWPDLFDPNKDPIVFRLSVPNIVAVKGSKRVLFSTVDDFRKVEKKYNGWEISYYKGLGSMVSDDWDSLLANIDDHLIPIQDDGNMKDTLELIFGNDTNARKEWLS